MKILAPISSIMTTRLYTVDSADKLLKVKEIFDNHPIHHLPVVRHKQIIGMISKTDLLHFLRGYTLTDEDKFVNEARMRNFTAEKIMTKGIAKVSPHDRINVALEVFLENRFHAIPVVENEDLVGIVTTFDIIKALAEEHISSDQILETQNL